MNRYPTRRKEPPPEDPRREPCPACLGRKGGYIPADWKTAPAAAEAPAEMVLVWEDCHFCRGDGEVGLKWGEMFPRRYALGLGMRTERHARGVTLRAEAARRRMSIAELSAMERGELEAKPQPPITQQTGRTVDVS